MTRYMYVYTYMMQMQYLFFDGAAKTGNAKTGKFFSDAKKEEHLVVNTCSLLQCFANVLLRCC